MSKDETSESEPENSSSASEGAETRIHAQHRDGVSEYEKQRLSRIAENKARMEALGLRKMVSSLTGSARSSRMKSKGKGKVVVEDDEDYRPEEEGPSSSTEEEEEEGNEDDDDEDYLGGRSSGSHKAKVHSWLKVAALMYEFLIKRIFFLLFGF